MSFVADSLTPIARHMLVWLSDAGWQAAIDAAPAAHLAGLALWRRHDWPVVVRRHDAHADANAGAGAGAGTGPAAAADAADADADADVDEVCLGLPLPPDAVSGTKLRIALRARTADVVRRTPPIALRDTLSTAGVWRDGLAALCDAVPSLRVYGSLAMQSLTGLQYVSPTSDIDVLFEPSGRQQLDHALALLTRYEELLPLDGEIVFPGGQAVSWKEWRMAMRHPAKVLVKDMQAVRLADTASLLALLEDR
ncbi:malonate decarboxylase holo-[acyl-carrier-protein] synthase [Duganella sp. FT80W]|uniref:Malonate decarboxylase holo-[acyl-carrier-protein] synthase n=1 Tax=Duganella guangzhouensis TaxID=2666084 RepID=A0A6I2L220_9BURK|nr:malonate decarboxylase holo-[acyl-carrier-protein] synthase [Duganella guangzhouensis]MRW90606.1 malonate decarboxylase holo-[acyl-carrier-protein] synthase [Duganella guangzhouensis]